jgi:aryl-alcohol dehydrogenase-like predicted oxidoreductase
MNTKKITGTELAVSEICLGMMSFGDPKWQAWVRESAFASLVVKTALECGINFFDTADVYSFGESERILGRAIKAHARRDQVVLATKFGLAKGIDVQGLRKEHVITAAEDSLRRLDTDYIDLYQMHGWDTGVPIEETLEALTELTRSGKIRYAGGSNFFAWQLAVADCAAKTRGSARLATMQVQYNLVYREEEREMLPYCRYSGTGVIVFSPLARGYLAGGPGTAAGSSAALRAETDKKRQRLYDSGPHGAVVDAVDAVAAAHGALRSQVAIAWILSKPEVTSIIVGPTELDHLTTALDALSLELSADEVARLERPYAVRATEVTEISRVPF